MELERFDHIDQFFAVLTGGFDKCLDERRFHDGLEFGLLVGAVDVDVHAFFPQLVGRLGGGGFGPLEIAVPQSALTVEDLDFMLVSPAEVLFFADDEDDVE